MTPYGVLCKQLDDVLTHFGAQDNVSLTDMLLMAGDASPTPGFLMLVQYVATLCHLHSIATVQLQFKLHNQQMLDISQPHVLAYGHKSLVVQLGMEDAVYKVRCTYAVLFLVSTCSHSIHNVLSEDWYDCIVALHSYCQGGGVSCRLLTISWLRTNS